MTDFSPHLMDGLADLVDGRLSGDARQRAEAHLVECEGCRREWKSLLAVKHALRQSAASAEYPAGLAEQIRAALDGEDAATGGPRAAESRRRSSLVWLAAAAVALVGVAALLIRPGVASRVASDYSIYRAGALPLQIETESANALEGFYRDRGLSLHTRVLDLRRMGYRIVGGRVHRLGKRPSALIAYHGEGNRILVCQMYSGPIGKLPSSADRREERGIAFYLVRRGRTTMVFWHEGDVSCVLSSDIPSEEVLELALSKLKSA